MGRYTFKYEHTVKYREPARFTAELLGLFELQGGDTRATDLHRFGQPRLIAFLEVAYLDLHPFGRNVSLERIRRCRTVDKCGDERK